MAEMRPSEHALASGFASAIGWGIVGGWKVGLTVLLMFVAIAWALRKVGRVGKYD